MKYFMRWFLVFLVLFSSMAKAGCIELGLPKCNWNHAQLSSYSLSDQAFQASINADTGTGLCECDCPLCKYSNHISFMQFTSPEVIDTNYDVSVHFISGYVRALSPDLIPLLQPPIA